MTFLLALLAGLWSELRATWRLLLDDVRVSWGLA